MPTYKEKLVQIEKHVSGLWNDKKARVRQDLNSGLFDVYTLHDETHSEKVVEALDKLIPGERANKLSAEEWFYLKASAWMHDIGMIKDLPGLEVDKIQDARKEHHKRTCDYILTNKLFTQLLLDESEAETIAEICKYHRRTEDINDLKLPRVQLLASYLRLADAIHIDRTRVDKSLFDIFLQVGMSWEMKFNWLKSFWIKDIEPDFENLTLTIQLNIPEGAVANIDIIKEMVENEIRSELTRVKDILIRHGISYFLYVKAKYSGVACTEDRRIQLSQVISNLQLERKPSASNVANIIFETLLQILNLPNSHDAHSTCQEYRKQVISNVIQKRPCHILVGRINQVLENHLKETTLPKATEKQQLDQVKAEIKKIQEDREEKIKALVEHAQSILSDYGAILLSGYSDLVIRSLKETQSEVKRETEIYICEGRERTQYNDMNELVYCDGLEYAFQVRAIGFEKVFLIPDILVGNLISRDIIKKVIFGANGVDINDGRIAHTAGHLSIAELAYSYNVPVYVIVDRYKFGTLGKYHDLQREKEWLTGDVQLLSRLRNEKIELYNPKEDIVEATRLHDFVTDLGTFPPHKIPKELRNFVKEG